VQTEKQPQKGLNWVLSILIIGSLIGIGKMAPDFTAGLTSIQTAQLSATLSGILSFALVLFFLGSIFLILRMSYLLYKLNPSGIKLAQILLGVEFLSGIFLLFISDVYGYIAILRAILWGSYLFGSEYVKATFPSDQRKLLQIDGLGVGIFVLAIIFYFGGWVFAGATEQITWETYDECIDIYQDEEFCMQDSYNWCLQQQNTDADYCTQYTNCLKATGTDDSCLNQYFVFE